MVAKCLSMWPLDQEVPSSIPMIFIGGPAIPILCQYIQKRTEEKIWPKLCYLKKLWYVMSWDKNYLTYTLLSPKRFIIISKAVDFCQGRSRVGIPEEIGIKLKISEWALELVIYNYSSKVRAVVVAQRYSACLMAERLWIRIPQGTRLISLFYPISNASLIHVT